MKRRCAGRGGQVPPRLWRILVWIDDGLKARGQARASELMTRGGRGMMLPACDQALCIDDCRFAGGFAFRGRFLRHGVSSLECCCGPSEGNGEIWPTLRRFAAMSTASLRTPALPAYTFCSSQLFRNLLEKRMPAIDRARLKSLMEREQKRFVTERPKSSALFERARKSLLGGVPMNWMAKWAGAFPPFVREAQGAEFFDVDGHRYIDLCLGDTGAMTGHSPSATVSAIEQQIRRGITLMLPSEDSIVVGEELQKRFGLPFWQFALTATDA